MSFRIPEATADALETDAQINNTSPSTLLTQILNRHMGYDGNMGKAGLLAFPKSLLVRLMDGYSEEKVIAMADYISQDATTDMMAILQNEYSIENFLQTIESWARVSHIPFIRETKGNLNTIVIQHNMTRNWSLYLGHLYKNVIQELTEKKVSIDVTNNTVRIKF